MKAPDAQQREAIANLQRLGVPWHLMLGWLQQNLTRAQHDCARADDLIHVRRVQGEIRTLADLIEYLTPRR